MSSNTEYPKVCAHCGARFIAKKITTAFCSHRCSSLSYKQKKRAKKVEIATIEADEQCKLPIFRTKKSQQIQPSDNNLSTLIDKVYLSVLETATLLGTCRATINNYCTSGKLKCIKMNRKIFIRRSDIDELFDSAPQYTVTPRASRTEKQSKEQKSSTATLSRDVMNTEFISAKEAAERFGVSVSAIHSRCRARDVPWILFQGTRIYSAKLLDELYKEEPTDSSIVGWYSVDDIIEQFAMKKSTIYSMVSDHKVPKRKEGAITFYSKKHIDELIKSRQGDTSFDSSYTFEELYAKYGLKPNYVSNFVYMNKIPRRKDGGKTLYSKEHFDIALEANNPTTVYLLIDDAAEYFKLSAKQIYYLIDKHNLPTMHSAALMRVQKVALNNIINPKKLYDNGN